MQAKFYHEGQALQAEDLLTVGEDSIRKHVPPERFRAITNGNKRRERNPKILARRNTSTERRGTNLQAKFELTNACEKTADSAD